MEKISKENLCNGDNQYWEFYLIGKNFNDHICDKIDSAKNHGLEKAFWKKTYRKNWEYIEEDLENSPEFKKLSELYARL